MPDEGLQFSARIPKYVAIPLVTLMTGSVVGWGALPSITGAVGVTPPIAGYRVQSNEARWASKTKLGCIGADGVLLNGENCMAKLLAEQAELAEYRAGRR